MDSNRYITTILGMNIVVMVIIASNNLVNIMQQEYTNIQPYDNILILQIRKSILNTLSKLIQGHKSSK